MSHPVLFTLALLVSSAVPAGAPVTRPPGAGTGKLFGEVELVQGKASLKSRISFAARPGMPVVEGDEIAVDTGYLLLLLRNGQVVRIDEEITLKTSEIIVSQARRKEDLDAQLTRLVGRAERKAVRDRIAGAYARVTAATDAPPESAVVPRKPLILKKPLSAAPSSPAMTRGPSPSAPAGGGSPALPARDESAAAAIGAQLAPAPARAPAPAPAPAPAAAAAAPAEEESSRGDLTRFAEKKAPVPAGESLDLERVPDAVAAMWSLRDTEGLHPQSGPQPRLIEKLRADRAFLACLEEALEPLPSHPASVEVLLRVKGGQVRRVVLGGALTPPACLARYARGKLPGVRQGWVSFTVPVR